jgi:hypothetical protein
MKFRIGVNLGDIAEDGDRIYGDGVNVAARIEGLGKDTNSLEAYLKFLQEYDPKVLQNMSNPIYGRGIRLVD